MDTANAGWQGQRAFVRVGPKDPTKGELEKKLKSLAEGRTITRIDLYGDQLSIHLDDGSDLNFNIEGGLREVN